MSVGYDELLAALGCPVLARAGSDDIGMQTYSIGLARWGRRS